MSMSDDERDTPAKGDQEQGPRVDRPNYARSRSWGAQLVPIVTDDDEPRIARARDVSEGGVVLRGFSVGDDYLRAKQPVSIEISDDGCVALLPALGLTFKVNDVDDSVPMERGEVVAELRRLWRDCSQAPDDQLTEDRRILKQRLLATFEQVDPAPPRPTPPAVRAPSELSETGRSLARSSFDEPRLWLDKTLRWIAFRRIGDLTTKDVGHERHRAILLGANDDGLVSRSPAADLLEALRVGDIEGIEPDGKELPPEAWDTVLSHDLRTWPKVRFRRADVLRLWPSREPLSNFVKSPASAIEEKRATEKLAAILRQEPNISKAQAKERLSDRSFSDQGFEVRIWPNARIEAGLEPRAPAGRKPRKKTSLIEEG